MVDAMGRRQARVRDLAEGTDGADLHGDDVVVNHITIDSREVKPGSLFAALRGSDFDGHAYIDAAIANGASALLVDRPGDYGVPTIVSANSRAALAPLSAAFYGQPSHELTMIGLTGTDGKTTTSYLVRHILQEAGVQTGVIGTIGIELGDGTTRSLPHQTTPESHLVQAYLREMVDCGTHAAVLEATSHGLAMHRLDGTRFAIAGVTNITREHLEYHGTIENYRRAKAMLIERVAAEGGTVVLNADDDGARSMQAYADDASVVWYGIHSDAEIGARSVVADNAGSTFRLEIDGSQLDVQLPMLGEFNVANALCAIGVCRAAGVEMRTIVDALATAQGVPGRMNRIDYGQPFSVVVDYAHTPESLHSILTLLRRLNPGGRLITVSGSAGERDPGKRPLQGAVTVEVGDLSVITSEDPRNEDADAIIDEIAAGARQAGGIDGETVFTITDRREAIRAAFSLARPSDCVLLAGKGHETSMIWGFEHRPWDEAQVAAGELAAIGYEEA